MDTSSKALNDAIIIAITARFHANLRFEQWTTSDGLEKSKQLYAKLEQCLKDEIKAKQALNEYLSRK